jgi:hypothetical protein
VLAAAAAVVSSAKLSARWRSEMCIVRSGCLVRRDVEMCMCVCNRWVVSKCGLRSVCLGSIVDALVSLRRSSFDCLRDVIVVPLETPTVYNFSFRERMRRFRCTREKNPTVLVPFFALCVADDNQILSLFHPTSEGNCDSRYTPNRQSPTIVPQTAAEMFFMRLTQLFSPLNVRATTRPAAINAMRTSAGPTTQPPENDREESI